MLWATRVRHKAATRFGPPQCLLLWLTNLEPAAFLVVALGARMKRSRESVCNHVLFRQVAKGWMKRLERVEIVEDSLYQRVDSVFRRIFRNCQGSQNAERVHVVGIVLVGAARNGGCRVVGMLLDQLVDEFALDADELRAAGRGRVCDIGGWMANTVEEGVDLVVAKRRSVLVRTQLRGQREVVARHADG